MYYGYVWQELALCYIMFSGMDMNECMRAVFKSAMYNFLWEKTGLVRSTPTKSESMP
jgi:hypothetical protein